MNSSKIRALWLAVNSECGDRLLQIAIEHLHLTQSLNENKSLSDINKATLAEQIERLRVERETILSHYNGM